MFGVVRLSAPSLQKDHTMAAPELSNPPTVAKPVGPYSHVALVKAGSDTFHFSGQVGTDAKGDVPEGIDAQAENAFTNILRLLEANGMTPANIAKQTIFVVAGNNVDAVRKARKKVFGDAYPASTLIFVSALVAPMLQIEVECVASR
jgi:ribosomal-protein-alanine N-acetyltransferase